MALKRLQIQTHGEKFYSITELINEQLESLCYGSSSGMLYIFCPHTSCGLTLNESYDPSARSDLENFLKSLAPRDLAFITHTDEGDDDSVSHMKTLTTGQSLSIIIEKSQMLIGRWQGIYLCEFRDLPKSREIYLKFMADK